MEDEGYTSPPPEDYTFHFTCPGQNVTDITAGDRSCTENEGQCVIPWEQIAIEPNFRSTHISWDDVPCPFPFRIRDLQNANKRNKKLLRQHFFSDNSKASSRAVDRIWKIRKSSRPRLPDVEEEDEVQDCGQGDADLCPAITTDVVQEIKLKKQSPAYITLTEFIHHLLHLLCGRESQSFTFMKTSNRVKVFQKNPMSLIHGMTPTSLNNFSQPFIQCGSIFRKLWIVAYELKQDDVGYYDGSGHNEGGINTGSASAVFIAFQRYIGDYLKLYQTILMLKGTTISSLTKLSAFISVSFLLK